VTFLGTEGPTYQLMRRYGINVYFGATFAAQLLLIGRLRALARTGSPLEPPWPRWLVPALMVTAGTVLAMGLLYLAVDWGLPLDRDRMQNTMEWSAALLMQLTMLLVARGWRSSGLQLQAGCRRPEEPRAHS
jgi:drug/metabolite transporter (DMT)-like permease